MYLDWHVWIILATRALVFLSRVCRFVHLKDALQYVAVRRKRTHEAQRARCEAAGKTKLRREPQNAALERPLSTDGLALKAYFTGNLRCSEGNSHHKEKRGEYD